MHFKNQFPTASKHSYCQLHSYGRYIYLQLRVYTTIYVREEASGKSLLQL